MIWITTENAPLKNGLNIMPFSQGVILLLLISTIKRHCSVALDLSWHFIALRGLYGLKRITAEGFVNIDRIRSFCWSTR